MIYQHTQIGTLILILAGIIALFALIMGYYTSWWVSSGMIILALLMTVLFGQLTVTVGEGKIHCHLGFVRLIHKSFALADITEVKPVRNPWYYGWGIRLTPHGWMFNVSGLDAVEITLSSGKQFRIGTDEPQRLASVIVQEVHGDSV